MLGFRKIRQLEPIIPTTGYLIPVANPSDSDINETFACSLSDALIHTRITYNTDNTLLTIQEKPKAFVYEKNQMILYCSEQGMGAADYVIEPIDIRFDIVDVISQTSAANCIITCPQHKFLDFDEVEIFNVDASVNQKWTIEVIDDDSFFLKGTKGRPAHASIYEGEGGVCRKRGGFRLDIYEKNHNPRNRDSGLIINLSTIKEIYHDEEPVLFLNIEGKNIWGRVEGIL